MRRPDPRLYQIAMLAGLLAYGVAELGFEFDGARVLGIVGVALLTQYGCGRLWRLPAFDPRSPLISALSLCLLLRSDSIWLAFAAAVVTIAGKFVLRFRGKHVFNPTNLGLVVMMLCSDRVWVSPGQWGNAAFFGFLLACLGGLVVNRAARSDVTYAFLGFYLTLLFGRAWWLGDPWTIPLHQLQSGAFLIFAFFMISDPRTTPDTRGGRVLFAFLVACGAGLIHFVLFRNNGLIWSLALCALAVPLIDRLMPGPHHRWAERRSAPMKRPILAVGCALTAVLAAGDAAAFCGFYVAKADTRLFNRASQVVIARHGDRTVLTMANDFQGDLREFAIVVPVPTFLEREQIHVADRALLEHLDAYTSPRLVEYFDPDPCQVRLDMVYKQMASLTPAAVGELDRAKGLGVSIEARYTVGEYDIVLLSATQSTGLLTWLTESGYRLPAGAESILGSYMKQGMRFFLARVNLDEQARLGFTYLRPLQVAFESPKFRLPIRLGTLNADGHQELFVYALTARGRVETTNYRSVKLPSGMDLPVYVKDRFAEFYRDMFTRQVEREDMRAVFLEYAWNMAWCDPCAADPLSREELLQLGVSWLDDDSGGAAEQVFVTRLHARYDAEHFPEDLVFQETGDTANFQARYVLRHAFEGGEDCDAGRRYREDLSRRRADEAESLALLTGWDLRDILQSMAAGGSSFEPVPLACTWWQRLWSGCGAR